MTTFKQFLMESVDIDTLSPTSLDATTMKSVVDLITKGGEVLSTGLESRIKKAKYVVVAKDGDAVVGFGAVKVPLYSYKQKIFVKAGVPELVDDVDLELGWLIVDENSRNKRIGGLVAKKLYDLTKNEPVFLSTRANNHTIISAAKRVGGKILGKPYQGKSDKIVLIGFNIE
jgi:hypothetical protein